MVDSLILQKPEGTAEQLVLLFHGVGAHAKDMAALGLRLAAAFPNAFVTSVDGEEASDLGSGRQWFSVQGITEENRAARIDAAMPAFLAAIRHWQAMAKVGVEGTALIGFSQGAIMSLESTKTMPAPAGRVVALAGRFATLPTDPQPHTTIHMIHGKEDRVMPYGLTIASARHLLALGADVTADVLPFVGHEIPDEMAELVIQRLQRYLPLRRWRDAMQSAPAPAAVPAHDVPTLS